MTSIPLSRPITEDGEYKFDTTYRGSRELQFEVTGTFGSGTATIGYQDAAGAFCSYKDGNGAAIAFSANGGYRCLVPASGILCLKVAGATTPSLTATLTKIPL
jgi:hypothetical protein